MPNFCQGATQCATMAHKYTFQSLECVPASDNKHEHEHTHIRTDRINILSRREFDSDQHSLISREYAFSSILSNAIYKK